MLTRTISRLFPVVAKARPGIPGLDQTTLASGKSSADIRSERSVISAEPAQTGCGAQDDVAMRRSGGFFVHLTKPVSLDGPGTLLTELSPPR